MTAVVTKLGPGTLKLGPPGTAIEAACQVTSVTLSADVTADDPVQVLCGDSVPGARTYAYKLAGTLLNDLSGPTATSIIDYSWSHIGQAVTFEYTPSTASTDKWSGTLMMDPLPIGGDTVGENMTADFEWAIVGTPTKSTPTVLEAEAVPEDSDEPVPAM